MTPDDDLIARAEAALAEALAIEPSAGFKAGVRRRIAEGGEPRRVRTGWLAAAAVLAVVLAGAVLHQARPVPRATQPSAISNQQSATTMTAPTGAKKARRAARATQPDVIVPAGEARRIDAYYASVARRPVAPATVVADELVIAPIDIVPLPDGETGASRGGAR